MLLAAAPEPEASGWGSRVLRRATLTLALSQLISWGVLFYGFAVVAPEISYETGWSESVVAGAFSLGLLLSGLTAPSIARALTTRDPRLVLTAGSLVGIGGMLLFAAAHSLPLLYLAWIVVGLAMAATLYEPTIAVLVALDPGRRLQTLTIVTVTGGLASTAFAPLTASLTESLGWRAAIVVLALAGGATTAVLHAVALPAVALQPTAPSVHPADVPITGALAQLRTALIFEQAAMLGVMVHLIGLLVSRGVSTGLAAMVLGTIGFGKMAGRLLLLGPPGKGVLPVVAAACSTVQLVGLTLPLLATTSLVLLPGALLVGAAGGATTVLRSLLIVQLVGIPSFASVSARIQRVTTMARAAAPLLVGAAVASVGWAAAWVLILAAFAVAAERYLTLPRPKTVVASEAV